jgi:hypothetical protein
MDIRFFQIFWKEIRLIDWFTGSWYSLQDIHYEVLKDKPYKYWTMFLPHDAAVHSLNDWKTRQDMMRELWYTTQILENFSWAIASRHSLVRDNFQFCWFDEEKCGRWLDILKEYKRRRNESTWSFMDDSEKNEARHTADSFGYLIRAVVEKLWFGEIEKILPSFDKNYSRW